MACFFAKALKVPTGWVTQASKVLGIDLGVAVELAEINIQVSRVEKRSETYKRIPWLGLLAAASVNRRADWSQSPGATPFIGSNSRSIGCPSV